MSPEERYRSCRNCGRVQPESLLNREGRCPTCGDSETPARAPDPSETGPHGGRGRGGADKGDDDKGDAGDGGAQAKTEKSGGR